MTKRQRLLMGIAVLTAAIPVSAWAQVDPGPRQGQPAAGGPLGSLTPAQNAFFADARVRFQEIDSVSGTVTGETGVGLGPRFNGNSCALCHAYPTVGGSSPPTNPQIALATLDGAKNTIPAFIQSAGPVRVARFKLNADGTPDGGVHDLFVISGRKDAPGCAITQPDFATAASTNNLSLRIPTPVFGAGLVESVPDSVLTASLAATATARQAAAIGGFFNTSGNDGTITRFGWKAQNKSLLMFAGEAYNVEQGVTNEIFPNERETDPHCQFNTTPEDTTNLTIPAHSTSPASDYSSDIVNQAMFARYSAPPAAQQPPPPSRAGAIPAVASGQQSFSAIGCDLCHTPTLTSGATPYTNNTAVSFSPYSDFALHNMGAGLNDGVSQGQASGADWRTAPLWGLGQRLFFLHDGRASDLVTAIKAHASTGSEANTVIARYQALSATQQQDLLVFLRSL